MNSSNGLPPGYRIHSFTTLESTNAEALRRLAAMDQAVTDRTVTDRTFAGPGDVILAESQTAGRGRRGRQWHSPPGNLYASIIAAPGTEVAENAAQLAFVAALGTGEAVAEIMPERARLRYKWPNDVLLNGAKLAGILIEWGAADCMVVGIGINIDNAPGGGGGGGGGLPATSLAAEGIAQIKPETLLVSVCRHFDDWLRRWQSEGFAPVRAAWLERAGGLGENIAAHLAAEVVHGRFSGLDEQGALLLDCQDGRRRVIPAGEIFFQAA
jgi:BirA family biotin operon repressor/biotin-[acetyl-CoA-carboxylase] ligase